MKILLVEDEKVKKKGRSLLTKTENKRESRWLLKQKNLRKVEKSLKGFGTL